MNASRTLRRWRLIEHWPEKFRVMYHAILGGLLIVMASTFEAVGSAWRTAAQHGDPTARAGANGYARCSVIAMRCLRSSTRPPAPVEQNNFVTPESLCTKVSRPRVDDFIDGPIKIMSSTRLCPH
ncbi:hypothetical protein [Burkholderia pyrrocinia]|uniref:hypothetical protein n=1 Tax=Burkholderia pyrrocinia TaxID=60550 RepID=UPI00158AF185|nr:hypothetical protein [Burkholderia pyrrocinia]